ncbi:MAG: hypothetical protein Q8K98_14420 [Bacteroidota bacterium]|nr:hypothetical protein [Bacteroidota bacterium]
MIAKIKIQYSNNPFIQFLLIVFCCLLFVGACRERVLPPDNGNGVHVPKLKIEAEDIGVTDCFIRLRFLDTSNVQAKIFLLTRDGKPLITNTLFTNDTLLLDEGLLPKRTYTYKAYRFINNTPIDSSLELLVPTLDTTSHNFTWQIDTLGDGNSSVLRDVFILNDTLAYAVGEIYKKDSLGQWETEMYNMAKWNGKEWKLTKAYFEYQGRPYVTQLYSIYAFSENDIWVASTHPANWNGTKWIQYPLGSSFPGYPTKFWGTSSSNLYMVGTNGSIAFFNGANWRRLELPPSAGQGGTDVNLTDVWGSPDGSVVWACGWEDFKPTVLLRMKNDILEKVYEDYNNRFKVRYDSLSGGLGSCWTNNNKYIYVLSSSGLYQTKNNTKGEARRYSFTNSYFPGFPWRVRGNAINDIFISGEYFMLAHFNGVSFKYFNQFYGDGRFKSLDQKGNQIVAVGYTFDPIHSRGIVIRGRR